MPEEIPGLREKLEFVKEKIRAGIDLDGILEAAEKAPELLIKIPEIIKNRKEKQSQEQPLSILCVMRFLMEAEQFLREKENWKRLQQIIKTPAAP